MNTPRKKNADKPEMWEVNFDDDFDFEEWVESEVRRRTKLALSEKNIEVVIENEVRRRVDRRVNAEIESALERQLPLVSILLLIILIGFPVLIAW